MKTVFHDRDIPGRIAEMRPFLSKGKLPDGTRRWSGHSGPATSYGHLPRKYHGSVRQAVYVVYSYDTPIAWVLEAPNSSTGDPYWFKVPDISYSITTGQHQMACVEAWADHMRAQGQYRRFPASHREVVRVPGMVDVYGGRTLHPRAGGIDGPTGYESDDRALHPRYETDDRAPDSTDDVGTHQYPPVRGWNHHPAHP
jgi:hypothetical protein